MPSQHDYVRQNLKTFLESTGIMPALRRYKYQAKKVATLDYHRHKYLQRQELRKFKQQYGEVFQHQLYRDHPDQKIALVCGCPFPEMYLELAVVKALELCGYQPIVLAHNGNALVPMAKYYQLAGIREIYQWHDFAGKPQVTAAMQVVRNCQSLEDLMAFEYEGARVGRYAVSTACRTYKTGSFDPQCEADRPALEGFVALSMGHAKGASRILDRFNPDLVLLYDKGYTPRGELFDHCLTRGIDVISWSAGHKSSTIVLKRFTVENRDEQDNTMTPETWRQVRDVELTDAHHELLHQELYRSYATNDWYSSAGTQHKKNFRDPEDIRASLGLIHEKKTAFIFPHILWDATLFWSGSLFKTYEEWLVETVRSACANDQVNWVIKIHPAHVGKGVREGYHGEPAEVVTLRKYFDKLPPHLFFIPADSDISTFSLFQLIDYCVTVRGTIGIEASRLGIPVLTAGSGPYDNRGFTLDSTSREQYFERLRYIQTIEPLSAQQQALAERFAFAHFISRPLPLTTIGLTYHDTLAEHLAQARVNITTREDWSKAPDLRAIAEWVQRPDELDFFQPLPDGANVRMGGEKLLRERGHCGRILGQGVAQTD